MKVKKDFRAEYGSPEKQESGRMGLTLTDKSIKVFVLAAAAGTKTFLF